jgi:hypothetical protein
MGRAVVLPGLGSVYVMSEAEGAGVTAFVLDAVGGCWAAGIRGAVSRGSITVCSAD